MPRGQRRHGRDSLRSACGRSSCATETVSGRVEEVFLDAIDPCASCVRSRSGPVVRTSSAMAALSNRGDSTHRRRQARSHGADPTNCRRQAGPVGHLELRGTSLPGATTGSAAGGRCARWLETTSISETGWAGLIQCTAHDRKGSLTERFRPPNFGWGLRFITMFGESKLRRARGLSVNPRLCLYSGTNSFVCLENENSAAVYESR